MTMIAKGIALSMTFAITALAASVPASAQQGQHRHIVVRQPPAMPPYGAHYGPDGVLYSSMGSPIPGYVLNEPNKCWTEDGYSHWSACDAD